MTLIELYCQERNAREASKEAGISYVTAKNFFDRIRRLLPALLETDYEQNRDRITEYDEYLYLDHSKRKDKRQIFDAHNLLTFDYGERVYSILMPPLDRFKLAFLDDGLEEIYYREFSRFLSIHRIARLKSRDNTIVRFWRFLDEHMKRYRGVNPENFFYYLKEAEFLFNYPMPRREAILRELLWEFNPNYAVESAPDVSMLGLQGG
ncbi:transposase [Nitratifractor sp.]